jgi:hypothetical protein
VASVVLSADVEFVRTVLGKLKAQPEFLPESLRGGGIAVLEDSFLESLFPIDQLPVSRATAPPPRGARVNLAPQRRPAPPRVNLAPAPARQSWWQGIWPFNRS